jgi:hypothetical protein
VRSPQFQQKARFVTGATPTVADASLGESN